MKLQLIPIIISTLIFSIFNTYIVSAQDETDEKYAPCFELDNFSMPFALEIDHFGEPLNEALFVDYIKTNGIAIYNQDGLDLEVVYSSPIKKGRVIFGELVPYDKVWRTGANEPTTFTTANTIKIIDKELAAGTYSLWTIPGKKSWKVILNKEVPDWGVTLMSGGKETTRNPNEDAIQVAVPVRSLQSIQENLDISFEDSNQLYLTLSWDETGIQVPINK